MIRWLADENFDNDVLRGVLRRSPAIDIVRAQDIGLSGASDERLLAWAAEENRIVVTHDVATLTAQAYRRLEQDQPMPGVVEVNRISAIGAVIDDLILISACCEAEELQRQILYLPLR